MRLSEAFMTTPCYVQTVRRPQGFRVCQLCALALWRHGQPSQGSSGYGLRTSRRERPAWTGTPTKGCVAGMLTLQRQRQVRQVRIPQRVQRSGRPGRW